MFQQRHTRGEGVSQRRSREGNSGQREQYATSTCLEGGPGLLCLGNAHRPVGLWCREKAERGVDENRGGEGPDHETPRGPGAALALLLRVRWEPSVALSVDVHGLILDLMGSLRLLRQAGPGRGSGGSGRWSKRCYIVNQDF